MRNLSWSNFGSQPTITIIVGSWLASALDAWVLKIMIEEDLEYPTELIFDLSLGGLVEVYTALATGVAHIYPEVR